MIINRSNLVTLGIGFRGNFQQGLGQASSQFEQVATIVPSTTAGEEYGWLGKVPNVREWIGDRVVQNIMLSDYRIKNKSFEQTIGVDRDHISDDNIGIYAPLFSEMGRATAAHYDQLVWSLLKAGFTTPCYDKQFFFDTDHPVLDEAGKEISVANTDGGAGTPWFLADLSRALKPIILQKRKAWEFVAKDRPDDDNVFDKKEFKYGVDARHNVGYGFWQFCWGSKQPLDATSYENARTKLSELKGDMGRPLGLNPTHLIVPPSLEGKALQILNAENNAAGASNVWKGTAQVMKVSWLA